MDLTKFVDVWTMEYDNSKFKKGDCVGYIGYNPEIPLKLYEVLAVNYVSEEEGFEYLLKDASYLVWEHELNGPYIPGTNLARYAHLPKERQHELYLEEAKINTPEGKICGFCGEENKFVDDYGWFWIESKTGEILPVCKSCWNGEPGEFHIQKHGLGDR
jgi:hypothetical protein